MTTHRQRKKRKLDVSNMTDAQVIALLKDDIVYKRSYEDAHYQYRNVALPEEIAAIRRAIFEEDEEERPLTEKEWRSLGVQGGLGWENYYIYKPHPEVLLFRRPVEFGRRAGQPLWDAVQDEIKEIREQQRVIYLRTVP